MNVEETTKVKEALKTRSVNSRLFAGSLEDLAAAIARVCRVSFDYTLDTIKQLVDDELLTPKLLCNGTPAYELNL